MKLTAKFYLLLLTILMVCPSYAQEWYIINTHFNTTFKFEWSFPYSIKQFSHFDFTSKADTMLLHREGVVAPEVKSASKDANDAFLYAGASKRASVNASAMKNSSSALVNGNSASSANEVSSMASGTSAFANGASNLTNGASAFANGAPVLTADASGAGVLAAVPFAVNDVDSITFAFDLNEESQTHNKYQVYALNVTTLGGKGVTSKEEYVPCFISLDGKDGYNHYSGSASIRGRGNSTWAWYDKKPYRIKLDSKHKMLGLAKEKDWVLLANYRDVTDLMNPFMFETARWMGMPYVNHTRFVELFIDGDYRGLYQLTEQVEQGSNRVDIAEDGGILLAMDVDDGPDGQSATTSSFWSSVFRMPMCVKYPKDADETQVDSIRELLRTLESTINNADYDGLDSLMDMKSFMTMAMLQEFCFNVEIHAPRSIYMYKDVNGKWAMGPFWDWDAGFDFDWSEMYTGHTYFNNFYSLVLGTDPATRKNINGNTPRFFTQMFKSKRYVEGYKELWNSVSDSIFTRNWAEMEKYIAELNKGAYARDIKRWPLTGGSGWNKITFVVADEIKKMKQWLENRKAYLDQVINDYPVPQEEPNHGDVTTVFCGTIVKNVNMNPSSGYSQSGTITIDRTELTNMFGATSSWITYSLVPLNADGTEGENTAAKSYGAWFNADGNTGSYGRSSHVFIESDNLYQWNYGCYPGQCVRGDSHTVYMQYRYTVSSSLVKVVDVKVNFGLGFMPEDDGTRLEEEAADGLMGMKSVGQIEITKEYSMNTLAAYSKQDIAIDMNSIVASFDGAVSASSLEFMAYKDKSNGELISWSDAKNLSGTWTSSNGFYMMFDGELATWQNSECKVGYNPTRGTIDFAYTADLGTPASGTVCTASVFLVCDNKQYYEIKLNITLK